MKSIRLRYIAELNPAVAEFDRLPDESTVGFLPLEAVWADSRADHGRTAVKKSVLSGYTRYRPGDVVLPKVAPTFQAARSMITQSVGAGTTELHVLRPRACVDARWICYATRSRHFLDAGVTAFQGVAGLQRVPGEFVSDFQIADLTFQDQRRIADFLDDRVARIDQIIAARRKQMRLVNESRRRTVDTVLDGASRGRVPVRRFLATKPSYGLLPSSVSEDPSWPRYVRTTDIGSNGHLKSDGFASVDPIFLADYALEKGDVLVSRSGTIGKCMVYSNAEPAVFAGYLVRLRFANVDPRAYWYFTFTQDFSDQLWANAVQSTIPNFNAERYIGMLIPDVRGDSGIVAHLDAEFQRLDAAEQALVRSIGLFTEYKSSLITAAVNSELDVTTAGRGVPA